MIVNERFFVRFFGFYEADPELTIRSEKGAAAPIGASWYLCLKK